MVIALTCPWSPALQRGLPWALHAVVATGEAPPARPAQSWPSSGADDIKIRTLDQIDRCR
eukprot:9291638-Pyramimonas_sp.AAC.1